jgi:hypothetical protein
VHSGILTAQMPSAIENVPLSRHPTTTSDAVNRIKAQIRWTDQDRIATTYNVEGDCARIRIPPARPPLRTDALWLHTCFEIFLLKQNGIGYFEFNFAPSTEWAMYSFKAYREPAPIIEVSPPEITLQRTSNGFELEASVDIPRSLDRSEPLCVALAAVIEDDAGALSYWAVCHRGGKPDFHHHVNFALQLQPPVIAVDRSSSGK